MSYTQFDGILYELWYNLVEMRVLSTNILATHPSYAKIITAYNELLVKNGKVNNLKFFREVILPEIPEYNVPSWYQFLRRFKTEAGIVTVKVNNIQIHSSKSSENNLSTTMLSNAQAQTDAIASALNISASALKDIMENPEMLSAKDRAELFLKVMKAQDGRVKAIGGLRADNREQERFDRMMDSGAFA